MSICEKERCSECDNDPCVCDDSPKKIIKVTLADNKVRNLDSMVETTFWRASGTPMSAEAFMKQLHGDLPVFFKSEAQLRKIWSLPSTRSRLLSELKENGYNDDQIHNMKLAISASTCDIFDVLNYVAYNKGVLPRLERANKAKIMLFDYDPDQQAFLNFVLDQYIKEGVKELDIDKLSELLKLKYNAIADAKETLGDIQRFVKTLLVFKNICIGRMWLDPHFGLTC